MSNSVQSVRGGQGQFGALLRTVLRDKRLLILDYDGTLAYLAIDWQSVRRDLARTAAELGFESTFRPLWPEMTRFRDQMGPEDLPALFRVIARHEAIGVDGQRPRSEIVDNVRRVLHEDPRQAMIFSSNLHETIKAGVRKLRLTSIAAIVGADDVAHWKPEPDGLNLLLERSGVEPESALFIGDSSTDAVAAAAAGVHFLAV